MFLPPNQPVEEAETIRFSAPVSGWEKFAFGTGEDSPIVDVNAVGEGTVALIPLVDDQAQYVAIAGAENDIYFKRPFDPASIADPAKVYAAGIARAEAVGRQVVVETPDPYFNAGVAASCAAVIGVYVEPCFVHGGNAWRIQQPGWRMMGSATAYGWHDLVGKALEFWDKNQVKVDNAKNQFVTTELGCQQAKASRFCGVGSVSYTHLTLPTIYSV